MFKKILKTIWRSLDHKGRYATVMGTLTAGAGNLPFIISLYTGKPSEVPLEGMLMLNLIGWGWVILPSTIKIISKAFTVEIKD